MASPPALGAQTISSLDAGVATVDYRSAPVEAVFTLTPALRFDGARSAASVSGTLSMFQGGEWGAQGLAAGSAFTPTLGAFRGELSLTANAVAYRSFTESWQYLAHARAHLHDARQGAWLGGGGGHTRIGAAWLPTLTGEVGLWARRGAVGVRGVAVHTAHTGRDGSGLFLPRGDQLSYTEVHGALTTSGHRLTVDLAGGSRFGERSDRGSWGSVSGTWWLSDHLAAVASVGSYLADPLQRLPAGRYAMLQMRVASRSPVTAAVRTADDFGIADAADSSGVRVIRVAARGAGRVELQGDMTDWQPVALDRGRGGVFELRLPLPAGTYRLSVRVDGGPWTAPPGVPARRDEFGAEVGVVVVP